MNESATFGAEEENNDFSLRFRRLFAKPELEFKLLLYAIASTEAHVRMLAHTSILPQPIAQRAVAALDDLRKRTREKNSVLLPEDADVYEAIDRHLQEHLGVEEAHLIRTAKSKNDQTSTDTRLYLREEVLQLAQMLLSLREILIDLARRDLDVVMPGYTHMQPAEAILLSHWWLMNESRFSRDFSRLIELFLRMNLLPLGACIMAGTREPIDRDMVAKSLGFDDVIQNSLDAVSDRDYQIEFGAAASLAGLHISQLGSELLLWATQEFAFISLPRHLTLNSHNMPLKRNPELLEVLRSRPSLVFGRLMEFIAELKAVPTGFSQDLQESIPGIADVTDTLRLLLGLATAILPGIEPDQRRMKEVACADLVNVSNALDYLLNRGINKDMAVRALEQLSTYCRTRSKFLSDLSLSEWQQFSPAFENDIYDHVAMEQSIAAYCSFGGSSIEQVELALNRAAENLKLDQSKLLEQRKKVPAFL